MELLQVELRGGNLKKQFSHENATFMNIIYLAVKWMLFIETKSLSFLLIPAFTGLDSSMSTWGWWGIFAAERYQTGQFVNANFYKLVAEIEEAEEMEDAFLQQFEKWRKNPKSCLTFALKLFSFNEYHPQLQIASARRHPPPDVIVSTSDLNVEESEEDSDVEVVSGPAEETNVESTGIEPPHKKRKLR